jgi:hypothetical protein
MERRFTQRKKEPMIAIIYSQLVVPVILLVVQTYVLLLTSIVVMKRTHLMTKAIDELEISQAVVASAILFGVFYISSADFNPYLQSYKISFAQSETTWQQTIGRFGRYFLHVAGAEIVFAMLAFLNIRLLTGVRKINREVAVGNLQVSIIASAILISFAILTRFALAEILDYITPMPVIIN